MGEANFYYFTCLNIAAITNHFAIKKQI